MDRGELMGVIGRVGVAILASALLWALADPVGEPLRPIVRLAIGIAGALWMNAVFKDAILLRSSRPPRRSGTWGSHRQPAPSS